MKSVQIMTNTDLPRFGKYQIWSNWIDVCVYQHNFQLFLVQMKISRWNGKKFRSIAMTRITHDVHAIPDVIGQMAPCQR